VFELLDYCNKEIENAREHIARSKELMDSESNIRDKVTCHGNAEYWAGKETALTNIRFKLEKIGIH